MPSLPPPIPAADMKDALVTSAFASTLSDASTPPSTAVAAAAASAAARASFRRSRRAVISAEYSSMIITTLAVHPAGPYHDRFFSHLSCIAASLITKASYTARSKRRPSKEGAAKIHLGISLAAASATLAPPWPSNTPHTVIRVVDRCGPAATELLMVGLRDFM